MKSMSFPIQTIPCLNETINKIEDAMRRPSRKLVVKKGYVSNSKKQDSITEISLDRFDLCCSWFKDILDHFM